MVQEPTGGAKYAGCIAKPPVVHTVTELPPSPELERRSRMIKYTIAMSIRVVCLALCLVVPGWWLLIPAVGAVFLPYFAVVIANNAHTGERGRVRRPGALVRRNPDDAS
ncbi:DUF3099 domain-containing protein [Protaetiibacter larvae]|uniref:DUF3099 domain-containing protein n=1 Tax=Protaetiibacter larvae TaxID=2592654 RepID=A0A5C1Y9H8_9MICO|nr:DUF3099 domain-containing protein [Protaetiibacter larvae]QEO10058.1 DUF3099 domain-containing protein [Protaetiibacter larvae]